MVQSAKRMAACIFSLLLIGGCAARHLRAEMPSAAAPQPENIAAAGAPGTGLQDPDHISFAQFPTAAIASAPAPQEWYGRLAGQEAAFVADLRTLDTNIRALDQRISKQFDALSICLYYLTAGILVGYAITISMWLPMAEYIFTFYHKGLLFIFSPRATV